MSLTDKFKLIVISVEKLNLIYNSYQIPSDINNLEELYIKSIDSKWIRSKQMFYFINKGEILKSDVELKNINSDIVLLTCSNLADVNPSSITSNNSLINNISNLIVQPLMGSSSSIIPYLNSDITNLSSNPQSLTLQTGNHIIPFNSMDNVSSVLPSPSDNQVLLNSINLQPPSTQSGNTIASGSQLMHEFTSTINNMLNSVNVTIDNESAIPEVTPSIAPIINSTNITLPHVTPPQVPPPVSSSPEITTSESTEQDTEPSAANQDIEFSITTVNNEGTNTELVNNTITQLLNIYQSGGSAQNINNIRERYTNELNELRSMGFEDENRLLIALYVCEGNCENAINYYLSLQDDL
jgi:hypothetical protein